MEQLTEKTIQIIKAQDIGPHDLFVVKIETGSKPGYDFVKSVGKEWREILDSCGISAKVVVIHDLSIVGIYGVTKEIEEAVKTPMEIIQERMQVLEVLERCF